VTWDVGARDVEGALDLLAHAAAGIDRPYAVGGFAGAARIRRVVESAEVLVWIGRDDRELWTDAVMAVPSRPAPGRITAQLAPDAFVPWARDRSGRTFGCGSRPSLPRLPGRRRTRIGRSRSDPDRDGLVKILVPTLLRRDAPPCWNPSGKGVAVIGAVAVQVALAGQDAAHADARRRRRAWSNEAVCAGGRRIVRASRARESRRCGGGVSSNGIHTPMLLL
jgi:hypothetical protein